MFREEDVSQAVKGQEAIICALGAGTNTRPNVCSEGTRHIINAMHTHGVSRIIAITGFGTSSESRRQMKVSTKLIVWPAALIFYKEFRDKEKQDHYIRQSGLDWTLVQPPTLTNGPWTGKYRLDIRQGSLLGRVSRADVADFILNQLSGGREFIHTSTVIYD